MPAAPKPPKLRKPPTLETLAQSFGADRWARLERQAAIVRGWNHDAFLREAQSLLDLHNVTHKPAQALTAAAHALLIALGSAPPRE